MRDFSFINQSREEFPVSSICKCILLLCCILRREYFLVVNKGNCSLCPKLGLEFSGFNS